MSGSKAILSDYVVCPYCQGEEADTDAYPKGIDDGPVRMTCFDCDDEFLVERFVVYTATPLPQDPPGGEG